MARFRYDFFISSILAERQRLILRKNLSAYFINPVATTTLRVSEVCCSAISPLAHFNNLSCWYSSDFTHEQLRGGSVKLSSFESIVSIFST
jgi:hypothetical protein